MRFIQLLANAPVVLIIKHNALSVNPYSQNRRLVLYLSCPASELIRNPSALQFDDVSEKVSLNIEKVSLNNVFQ